MDFEILSKGCDVVARIGPSLGICKTKAILAKISLDSAAASAR